MQAGSPHDAAPGSGVTLHLEVISGNAAGQSITVEDELVIGRLAAGDGRLEEDPELSRHHARISRERDGRYAIEDLGSSNGTFVNGLRLTSPGLLVAGDSIELGGTTLVVREITSPQAPAAAEPAPTEAPDPFRDATVFARVPTPALDDDVTETADPLQPTATGEAPAADPAPNATIDPAPEATEPRDAPSEPPTPAAETLPPLEVRVSIDVQAREAELRVGKHGERLRFVLEADGWSFAGPGEA